MEPHRLSRSSRDGPFGVRVRVQGFKGQPYVVLNGSGPESRRDVSVVTHQAGGGPDVRGSVDERRSPPGSRPTSASSLWHYQRGPEILRPYDPQSNNLNFLPSAALVDGPEQPEPGRAAPTHKPRIPLPAEGPVDAKSEEPAAKAPSSGRQLPARSPNAVDTESILSVGQLISQFNSSQRRRGRAAPRSRLDPEQCQRSRSLDSRPTAGSSPSSSTSSGASSLRGNGAQMCPPGPARARPLGAQKERTAASLPVRGHNGGQAATPEKPSVFTLCGDQAGESSERGAQVTPDLLKGQQEVPVDPPQDATRQMLFAYLKNGTDDEPTTERKVASMLETVNKIKWEAADSVEGPEENDYAAEVKFLQEQQEFLERGMSDLKRQLETEMENEKTLAKACEKARTEKKKVQEELAKSQEEVFKLRDKLAETEAELQAAKQELTHKKAERERSKTQMKDLELQLSEMHDELDRAKKEEPTNGDRDALLKEVAQLRDDCQETLRQKEEQEELLRQREEELSALKGAFKDEVETHDRYMAALKEERENEFQKLLREVDLFKESHIQLGQEKARAEDERVWAHSQVKDLLLQRDQLKGKVQELNLKVEQLNQAIQELRSTGRLLEQRAKQLEREKQQAEEALKDARRSEEEMGQSNQTLLSRLEEVQSKLARLNHEHREVKEKRKEERRQTEELWKTKAQLEDERRLQDRTVEQLQRKMDSIMEECEASTHVLQSQVDEARERSQRELDELRRQLQERGAELEKCRQAGSKLQEELLPLEEELRQCRGEQQEAQQRCRQLEKRAEELEERNAAALGERERHVKVLEGRVGQLEEDLGEERSGSDRMLERLDRTKSQMDQMRNELLQERTARQDLECDKMSLERQNKDLRSRITHLEGSQKTSQDSLVSRLNGRIQELEERLQQEERDNSSLQQSNRKLERKAKEMKMQADDEHLNLQSERDQLTQRLKTAKRQMDQAEEEIERLEHAKKKLLRDLDEQMEANEQLQGHLSSLRNEMRRKKKSPCLLRATDDAVNNIDDLGSD